MNFTAIMTAKTHTFFMKRLSCLEHLSIFSLRTEISERMLRRVRKQMRWREMEMERDKGHTHTSRHNLAASQQLNIKL